MLQDRGTMNAPRPRRVEEARRPWCSWDSGMERLKGHACRETRPPRHCRKRSLETAPCVHLKTNPLFLPK